MTGNCLQVLDVGNPAAPAPLISLDLAAPITSLHKAGKLLCVGQPHRLSIFDVTNPVDPILLSVTSSRVPGCGEFEFAVAGGYAYANCIEAYPGSFSIVLILDVSDPLTPTWVGEYKLPDPAHDYAIAAALGTLYLVSEYGDSTDVVEIYIVDVRNPANPTLLGTVPPASTGYLEDVVAHFPNLYVYRGDTLQIVNVLDPGDPRRTATLSASGRTIALTDGVIYVVDEYDESLLTVFVDSPTTPVPFMTTVACDLGCGVDVAAAQQDLLFTGDLESGFFVRRFTQPGEIHAVFLPAAGK